MNLKESLNILTQAGYTVLNEALKNNLESNNPLETFVKEVSSIYRRNECNPENNVWCSQQKPDGTYEIQVCVYGSYLHLADVSIDEDGDYVFAIRIIGLTLTGKLKCFNIKTEYLSTCTPKRFFQMYIHPLVIAIQKRHALPGVHY